MATKLARVFQVIFGSGGPTQDFESFGSDAAGSAVYTTNIATIMGTAAWLNGWFAATDSGNQPPRIQDFNAVDLLITTQLAYLFQEGIAEYDPTTEYFIGSFCQVAGVVYVSQSNSNAGNNPTTDGGTNWKMTVAGIVPGTNWASALAANLGAGGEALLGLPALGTGWAAAIAANLSAFVAPNATELAGVTPAALGLAILALAGSSGNNWAATLAQPSARAIVRTSGTLGALTVSADTEYILSAATTATMPPTATAVAGQRITFKNKGAFISTFIPNSGQTMDVGSSYSLYAAGDYVTFEWDGTSVWYAVASGRLANNNFQGQKVLLTSGSGNYIVPNGVYQLRVTCVGGGGGGGGGGSSSAQSGGGGGGGTLISLLTASIVAVTPGQSIAYSVGGGGSAGGIAGAGGIGGSTTFAGAATGVGGNGGAPGGNPGGQGGAGPSGGAGAAGSNGVTNASGTSYESSGGAGGGAGGQGGVSGVGGAGNYGGGGGGGATDDAGGSGGSGVIIIEY